MLRREFFRPPVPPPSDLPVPARDGSALIRASRRAMATTFEIALPLGTRDALAAADDALDVIDEVEDELTIYRESSEVARLNAAAGTQAVTVSATLFDLLVKCAAWTRDTAGGFDIAAGALVEAWGFRTRQGRFPPAAELAFARANAGMRHVALDERTRTVKFRRAGVKLNFGSVGKGYALDRAAVMLRRWGVTSALLHGGGSSVLSGVGTLGTVSVNDCGFGTSAATFQFFEHQGQRYGHVIDPRSGVPAAGTASASALAPTAAEADALSTAFFVRGVGAARAYITPRPALAALILPEGSGHPEAVLSTPGTS
jgi:thiamine biosynthesis lipoprotein